MKAITSQHHFFLPLWSMLQDGYRNVPRWKGYRDANPNLPLQTNLEHQNSLNTLFLAALPVIGEGDLNRVMLVQASLVHELGEVDNGDTLYHLKSEDKHLKELKSFDSIITRHLDFLGTSLIDVYRYIYILQHVTNESVKFVGHPWAEEMLKRARVNSLAEGQVFDALERLDYVLYAIRCFQECKDFVILKHVYCNQVKKLDEYAKSIRGFNIWWTKKMSAAAKRFMVRYADIPAPEAEGGIPGAYAYAVKKGYMKL